MNCSQQLTALVHNGAHVNNELLKNTLIWSWPDVQFNSIQVYLYSAFYDTNCCKAALQEIKFLQYIYIL